MDLREAYATLGLDSSATKEEAKKAYKKMAVKHHPDKTDGNADLFKKINEAHQVIEKGKDFGPSVGRGNPGGNTGNQSYYNGDIDIDIEDLIRNHHGGNPFNNRNRQVRTVEDKKLTIDLSFQESVLGCQKEISYKRIVKCDPCQGSGFKTVHNGCAACSGTGMKIQRHHNVIMQSTCNSCHGKQKTEPCSNCKKEGFLESETKATVGIPSGVTDGRNTLRLQSMGDYAGNMMGMDMYASVILTVNVEKNKFLKIENQDVVTACELSLLEAVEGTVKQVTTIDGNSMIRVPRMSKHRDEVILPNLGVSRIGNQRVILEVKYPNDLLEILSKHELDKIEKATTKEN